MATQAGRLIQVHPWGSGERTASRRRRAEGSARGLAGGRSRGIVREAMGGLFVLGSWAALWTWFLVATW